MKADESILNITQALLNESLTFDDEKMRENVLFKFYYFAILVSEL